jgi:hypothetical protein
VLVDAEGLAALDQREIQRTHPRPAGRDAEQEVFPVQGERPDAVFCN